MSVRQYQTRTFQNKSTPPTTQNDKCMKASEAKAITEQQLKGPVIEPLLQFCYQRIKTAAEQGKSQIIDPLHGIRTPVCLEQREAVYQQLVIDGYKVEHHPEPDHGHPCSAPYTTVSW